jgi:hypothetical protein
MSVTWLDDPGDSALLHWVVDHLDYPHDYCLVWPYSRNSAGYGTLARADKRVYVHRLICEKIHGPAPEGYQAAHSCGRGDQGCVNPRHLSWKSPADNQLDRRAHGTFGTCKLTQTQVEAVRSLKGKETPASIAQRLGVTEANIRQILNGQTWQPGAKRRLSPEAVWAILDAKGKRTRREPATRTARFCLRHAPRAVTPNKRWDR